MKIDSPRKCVLVVDDELLIRLFSVDYLNDNGFDTLEASDYVEAMAAFSEHPEIGALLTDINMPGEFDGCHLANRVRSDWPSVPIVLMSGRMSPATCDMPMRCQFMAKPFTGPQMLTALAAAQHEL